MKSEQTKILESIIQDFEQVLTIPFLDISKNEFCIRIQKNFRSSRNKSELIRRILNGVTLSESEIINLLKIIYFKRSKKNEAKQF